MATTQAPAALPDQPCADCLHEVPGAGPRTPAVPRRIAFWLLAFGLVLSVALMGVASTWIARLLDRFFWISWVGLGIITFVALRMIWGGSTEILKQTAALTLS